MSNIEDAGSGKRVQNISAIEWEDLIKQTEQNVNAKPVINLIKHLFIIDRIDYGKFICNYSILKDPHAGFLNENLGTKTIRDISYIPPAFSIYFVAAYPDIFQWIQKEYDSIELMKEIGNNFEGYYDNNMLSLKALRLLIDEYLKLYKILECQ